MKNPDRAAASPRNARRLARPVAFVTFALLCLPVLSAAELYEGQVVSESGAPLANARVRVNGAAALVDDAGRFAFELDANSLARIDVAADEHYRFVHTVAASDLSLGGELFARIELVQKRPQRRLLLFTGDAMLTRRCLEPRDNEPVLVSPGSIAEDARRLLDPIRPYIGLADFASVNLETTLSTTVPGEPLPKTFLALTR